MELFLNLVWLAIAASTLLAFLWKNAFDRSRFRLGLAALVCALIFLLPAISITDDLHANAFMVEEVGIAKRLLPGTVKANIGAHVAWLPISFRALLTALLSWTRSRFRASSPCLPTFLRSLRFIDRAPPFASA